MNPVLPFLISIVGLIALCPVAIGAPDKAADPLAALHAQIRGKRETAVLFVGNSYSFGAPKAFLKLSTQGGRRVVVDQVTRGGWTLAKHAADEPTLRKIRERRWDVVVFQEQSRIPSLPALHRDAAMSGPLKKLAKVAREQGAVPVLYQTWGYRGGDAKLKGDDFHAMTARLREGYRAAAANAGNLVVVPVGDAWEREVRAGRGARLFMPDGSHPTPDGNALIAKVFHQQLFPPHK